MVADRETEQTGICDIVIPVYNSLSLLETCIESLLRNTKSDQYHACLVDDASDEKTAKYIESLTEKHANFSSIRNQENLGYVQSCNRGIQRGSAQYIVILNSDVILSPNWLECLVECAESDPRIAAVNPVTNHAANINLPLFRGGNYLAMDFILRTEAQRKFPDIVTCVGFCLLLRRSALDSVGLFDEVYGKGYCEEADLCMRLTTNGWRTVLASHVYVYHEGSGSFADRTERYIKNRILFDERWKDEYRRQFKLFRRKDPLKEIRAHFKTRMRWTPLRSLRETYRNVRVRIKKDQKAGALKALIKGLLELPGARDSVISPDYLERLERPELFRVTYVLPYVTVAGGVLSVIQLVNNLILSGVEARIVALREYPEVYKWRCLTRPIIYRNPSELMRKFPKSEIAVATSWQTVPWVHDVTKSGKARQSVHFVQDYESWFIPPDDAQRQNYVRDTYRMISNRIVKSSWLQEKLRELGHSSYKIPLGMNLEMFYPRDVEPSQTVKIIAMARPRTPRRGFVYLVDALARVKQAFPETEIMFFGDDLSKVDIPFHYIDCGVVTDQNQLAHLYSSADIFIDTSTFQGFGRPALEAMACGTACVLTDAGGTSEYARDTYNCLLVPPKDPVSCARAIKSLLKDIQLQKTLVKNGLETVKDYCQKREAEETIRYFKNVVNESKRPQGN